jgi:hypothetical protein
MDNAQCMEALCESQSRHRLIAGGYFFILVCWVLYAVIVIKQVDRLTKEVKSCQREGFIQTNCHRHLSQLGRDIR